MNTSDISSFINTIISSKPSKAIRLLLMVFFVSSFVNFASAQSQIFTTSGTFIVPCDVTSITVKVWGGGGAGDNTYNKGGGGGAFAQSTFDVTSGSVYTVTIGQGGAYGTGNNGQDSSFSTIVIAKGGNGGNGGSNPGRGGQALASTGVIKYNGGNGGTSSAKGGAGGGASAGTGNDGANGSDSSSNTGGNGGLGINGGGNGGTGGNNNASGADGVAPGGGGGEKGKNGGSSGGGGNGKVVITYTSSLFTYCTPSFNAGVEPITNVTFAGINNTSTNAIGGSSLETFCIAGSVIQGSTTNVISVKGNTNGNYTDYYKVYIDWDQNGDFGNNTNEITSLGIITNSTGIDAKVLTGNISVPATAILGTTKMRVIKIYDTSTSNPCFSGSYYGQAEDYLINVTSPITITSISPSAGCVGSTITINGTNLSGATAANVRIGGTAVTSITSNTATQIVAVVGNGTTGVVTVTISGNTATSVSSFTVNPTTVGGSVSGGTTICSGNPSALLTLSGHLGTVVKWQSAVSPFSTWTDISNTGTTYTSGALTATTQFRAEVQSGSCAAANSVVTTVTVSPSLSNNNLTYTNGTSAQISVTSPENSNAALNAPAGTYFSSVNFASYGTPTGTSPNFVINPSCHSASSQSVAEAFLLGNSTATIPATNGVFGDPCVGTFKRLNVVATYVEPLCSGSAITISGSLPTGGNGSYTYLWESSTTSATSGFAAAAGINNGISYLSGAVTQNIWYRRTVTSASCSITSATVFIRVNPTPSTPTVGTSTQPDCVTATGSVVLSGLPAGNWTINPGGINGNTSSTTISGLAVGIHNFTVSSGSCSSSATTNVVINPALTNTWTGVWSQGTPNATQKIVFADNYPSTENITACSCMVTSGTVVFNSGHTLTLTNELDVRPAGSLTFQDTASLVQINDVNNSGIITYKRNISSPRVADYTYWSSPVDSQNLDLSVFYTSGMYYSYDDFAIPEDWKEETAETIMQIGKGYIVRGPQTMLPPGIYYATFKGIPNNGTKSILVSGGEKSNLIGNPYPSAIDADAFLTTNSAAIDGTLYFWTHSTSMQDRNLIVGINPDGTPKAGSGALAYTTDDYASYNLTGGVGVGNFKDLDNDGIVDPGEEDESNRPIGYIGAGQGFFATSTATGGPVTFNNAMRLPGTTLPDNKGINQQFFKTKNSKEKTTAAIEKNRVWLNLTNTKGAFKQTLIGYLTDATNEYDSRFDGESFDGQEFIDFYSINQDKNLTIQGRALPFNENDEVPLGIRSTIEGPFTISIDQVDGLLANQAVFIEDKLTNTVTDLKTTNYTFNTAAGTFNDRFVLRYISSKTLGTDSVVVAQNEVFVSVKNKQIKINSFSETIDKVTIYDVLGRQIYQKGNVNNNEFLISNLVSNQQTLIVKTSLQNGKTVTDKIIY